MVIDYIVVFRRSTAPSVKAMRVGNRISVNLFPAEYPNLDLESSAMTESNILGHQAAERRK